MNLRQHIIFTSSPQFTLGFTLGVAHSIGLDVCIMTCIYHYGITHTFHRPESPLSPPPSSNHWSFYCFHSFAFSAMSYSWNHTVYSLFTLAFFHLTICMYNFSMCFHGTIAHFLLALSDIPLSGWATVYLSIHLWKDILVASKCWKLWIKLL